MAKDSFDDLFAGLRGKSSSKSSIPTSKTSKNSSEKSGINKPLVNKKASNQQAKNDSTQKALGSRISASSNDRVNTTQKELKPVKQPATASDKGSVKDTSVQSTHPTNHTVNKTTPRAKNMLDTVLGKPGSKPASIQKTSKPAPKSTTSKAVKSDKSSSDKVIDKGASKPVNKQTGKPAGKDTKPTSKESNHVAPTKPAIPISLDKPGMDKIIVTPDGHNLSDMLPHLRSGGRDTLEAELKKYRVGDKAVEINGKTLSDNRYTKHKEVIEKNHNRQEAKRKLAVRYIQKNARYTEDEKIIMTNLGFSPSQFKKMMNAPESELTRADKEKILAMGGKSLERVYKGKRFRITHADNEILEFLAKFKVAGTRILSKLKGETQGATNRRMRRMKRGGVVADYEIPGLGTVWTITEIGMGLTGYELKTYRQAKPKMSTLPPVIGVNYIASCLWRNNFNVLYLDDYPSHNKTLFGSDGKQWREVGEDLVSELEIRSSFAKEQALYAPGQGVRANATSQENIIKKAQLEWHQWVKDGKNPISPEMYPGNEYMWIVFPEGGLTVSHHIPDLVLSRDRDKDGTPHSIAVECELTKKKQQNYINTMRAYKEDKYIYEKVVWVTNSRAIERALTEAAEKVDFDRFDIVPFTNEQGIYRNRDIWYI